MLNDELKGTSRQQDYFIETKRQKFPLKSVENSLHCILRYMNKTQLCALLGKNWQYNDYEHICGS